jgi:hypothetical protein
LKGKKPMNNGRPTAKTYRRALAAANPNFGWAEIPDCPMEIFTRILGEREQQHPEAAQPITELRARILNEAIYHSKKIANIQPPEWRAEFAWLLALSNTDGTFEADAQSVWSQAYAHSRPDFTTDKVAQLLDEYARVGLLLRKQDVDGRLWGFWAGSDNFQPPPSRKNHYKQGKRALFDNVQPLCTPGVPQVQPLANQGITFGQGELDSDFDFKKDSDLDTDPDRQQPKISGQSVSSVCESSSSSKSKSESQTERERWLEFINDPKAGIPDSLKYAEPKAEERAKILAQLDAVVIEGRALKNGTTKAEWLGNSISDWEEQQSPPLGTLNFGRWKRWLETGNPNG